MYIKCAIGYVCIYVNLSAGGLSQTVKTSFEISPPPHTGINNLHYIRTASPCINYDKR